MSLTWEKRQLSEVAKVVTGKTPPTANPALFEGNVPFVCPGDLGAGRDVSFSERALSNEGARHAPIVPKGSTLFTCIGSTIGKTGLAVTEVRTNQQINAAIPRNINGEFLYYWLEFNANKIKMLAATQAVPIISKSEFETILIDCPPLAEQERIVEILTDADAAIAVAETSLQRKNKELKALQQKLFAPIYSGRNHRLDEFLSLRNERILPHDDIPLFSLTIEDGVCPKSERYDREHLVSDTSAKKYKVVYPDDIVFNPQNVRWGAIARSYQSAPVCLSPIYEVMHVIEERADPDFFDHFLTCDRQVAYYAANTEGSLIERMAFKADAMMSLKFNIPSIEEQRNIAQALECYRAHIGHQNFLVTALKKQKRGLMQQLLTGKLRVPEKV